MRKKKINWFVIKVAALTLLLAAAVLLAFWKISPADGRADGKYYVDVYFRNNENYAWEKEARGVPVGHETEIVKSALDELRLGPKSPKLSRSIPTFIDPLNVKITRETKDDGKEERVAVINFNDTYYQMTALQAADCVTSLVWTLTGLGSIDGVYITVNDEPIEAGDGVAAGELSRKNVKTEVWLSEAMIAETVVLYFPSRDGSALVAETRNVERETGVSAETSIVRALLDGPRTMGLVAALPKEVSVISTKRDDVICYVDLSGEFVTKFDNYPDKARMAAISIVNSLTERPGIKKVQILIDGDRVELNGLDLSVALERDDTLIIK